ncbi:MAG: hypothetical protein K0M66_15200 [Thiobacillus sp.]|nr:hypothetical protein [Thiobacillus sp.]
MAYDAVKITLLVSCLLLSACSETIHWQDEALLSSGQTIIVNRTVERIPAELGHRRATSYEIEAKYPDTGKTMEWEGDFGLGPIMLDFKDGIAFVVAKPVMCDAKINEFSIAGFPYIFMRSLDGKKWEVISPDQFPKEFKKTNLSAFYDEYRIGKGSPQSAAKISQENESVEKTSNGYFQVAIPRSPDEWGYKLNKTFKGCS